MSTLRKSKNFLRGLSVVASSKKYSAPPQSGVYDFKTGNREQGTGNNYDRHCERPDGSAAIQKSIVDCFVARLLAMTLKERLKKKYKMLF